MRRKFARREFLEIGAASALGMALVNAGNGQKSDAADKPIRLGIVGVGNRGRSLLEVLLAMEGIAFPALCDINLENLEKAQNMVVEAGHKKPEGYSRGETDYERMMTRDDLDAVIIATPWHWHTPMAVCGMKSGKYVGVEVPAAITMDECWELVNTHEKTRVPCMMLENWSFRRDNLAVLNMIREGLFGEIVHCHCAHSHDCVDHWFFDPQGNMRWGGEYLLTRNCAMYTTHALGPVVSWMNIGCGDYFSYLTATATRSIGINAYFTRKFGADHPNAKRQYKQGDIVTAVVKTHKGNSIVINYDMQLPRPYDNRWMIQGTLGLYDEDRSAVYITGKSPKYHEWEPFGPYQEKCDHSWWRNMNAKEREAGHGGTDWLELEKFLTAVRNKTQTPIDVYDSVIMSVIIPLSEQSIANGSAPVECPDFTHGRWKTNKPTFALDGKA